MTAIRGAYPVLITPMTQEQEIDWGGVKNNVNYFVDQGVAGIVINGSTGEFVSLSREEKYQMVETVMKEAGGRIPVIVVLLRKQQGKQLSIQSKLKYMERMLL